MVTVLKPWRIKKLNGCNKANANFRIYKYWLNHPAMSSKDLSTHFNKSEAGISYLLSTHIKKYGMNKMNL